MGKTWQDTTLLRLKTLMQSFDAVQAMFVVGSLANDAIQPDYWSDIDLVIVVSDPAIAQFYPDTDWLMPINSIFATSHSHNPPRYTLRVCFTDMRRIDFIFLPASVFVDPNSYILLKIPEERQLLFSKIPQIETRFLEKSGVLPAEQDPDTKFSTMSNDFWFKGMLAVYKVVRNDLLIALHLTLGMMQDCLVLRMMLRDRTDGTRYHRIGGDGNELVDQMNAQPHVYSAGGILAIIEYYSQIYDNLGKEWSTSYETKRDPLLDWIKQVREQLSDQENLARKEFDIRS